MRSSIVLVAAVATGALGTPHMLARRDVVTVVDYVYATDWVTVTASSDASSSGSASADGTYHGRHYTYHSSSVSSSSSAVVVPSSSSAVVVPSSSSAVVVPSSSTQRSSSAAPTVPTSTRVASTTTSVAPTSTSVRSTSTSVAPTTSSTKAAATSAAASSSPVASPTLSAASSKPTTYEQIVVAHHNVHRNNHSATDLKWSADLAATAASIAASCVYAHNTDANGGGYGQNIAAGVEANNVSAVITSLFYNGEVLYFKDLYDQAQPSMAEFKHWGHFSQIVWKATTEVGCATQDCSRTGLANTGSNVAPYFTVCNYKSPGNYDKQYAANVGKSLDHPTVEWNWAL
ncbi:hypothetical protein LTR50_004340 [Elasticomyces elasticus]|nr:hypothetical protein LTR50_004340 [Elasticomyces elasticus]